jgi:hypothetical protein
MWVDVAAALGHAPVVQQDDAALGRAFVERAGDRSLGLGALAEGELVLRRVPEPEQQAADVRVDIAGAALAIGLASLVLTVQAQPRESAVRRLRRGRVSRESRRPLGMAST